jgi:hypothetical protein
VLDEAAMDEGGGDEDEDDDLDLDVDPYSDDGIDPYS